MEMGYSDVSRRLIEYRKKLSMSQESFGKLFGITQSYYAKLERGEYVLSYEYLENFVRNGGDVCWLLTNESEYHGVMEKYFVVRKTDFGRHQMMSELLTLARVGACLSNLDAEHNLNRVEKYIYLSRYQQKDSTIWENIRKVEDISQVEMADKLSLEIKRYRRIEKMQLGPNAEVLISLYENLGYSPLIILNKESYYLQEINKTWESFDDSLKKSLTDKLDRFVALIEKCEVIWEEKERVRLEQDADISDELKNEIEKIESGL